MRNGEDRRAKRGPRREGSPVLWLLAVCYVVIRGPRAASLRRCSPARSLAAGLLLLLCIADPLPLVAMRFSSLVCIVALLFAACVVISVAADGPSPAAATTAAGPQATQPAAAAASAQPAQPTPVVQNGVRVGSGQTTPPPAPAAAGVSYVRELTDDSFEHDTQASTGSTTGDWFSQRTTRTAADQQRGQGMHR